MAMFYTESLSMSGDTSSCHYTHTWENSVKLTGPEHLSPSYFEGAKVLAVFKTEIATPYIIGALGYKSRPFIY
jgi:hypothetical protein